ncbi:MAG: sugar phosphate nucleotidyltransferase [Kiritimatiellae bacterium]|nr:sugar phosphate nucleotidyltransferase [Kiritimatiellia bacterium]
MKHARQNTLPVLPETPESITPRGVVLIGAGGPLPELIRLLREQDGLACQGILDPDPALKGELIEGLVVLGWLGDIPRHASCAVIGSPKRPNAFDRKSVYHILLRQGLCLPVLQAHSAVSAPDVTLPAGTVLLEGSVVKPGASLGVNCLLEPGAKVTRCAALGEHTILRRNTTWRKTGPAPSGQTEMHQQLEAVLAQEHEPLQRIIERINWANMEIILVVNPQGVLIGTITDGDIRRGLLAGVDLNLPAALIMNRTPTTAPQGLSRKEMLRIMREKSIRHLPVLDGEGRPVLLERMEHILDAISGHDAIVMAGGLGSRLRPLTNNTPKPLLPVGNRPILDHILGGLKSAGIEEVVLSLNYRGDQIRHHVGDGEQHGLRVNYVTEKERLGTAGALSLLNPRPTRPFLVMNGDLLTNLNYAKLLRFQQENDYALVMCVRQYKIQVPYGVVQVTPEGQINALQEKPVHEHFINAGIYVMKPRCLDYIPRRSYFDMTDLTTLLIEHGESVGAFPLVEYWRDIGRAEDLRAASEEHHRHVTAAGEALPRNVRIPMEALA